MKTSRTSIDTPALIVDLDALERNIATMAARAKAWGVALRPHAKTHKCSAIARRQVEAGAIGIACATIDEAEVMVEADLPGVLVTSPLATEHKVRRFTELLHRRPDLAVVADHPQHVVLLAEMARCYSVAPSVLVDLDVGDHRTGTATLEAAVNLAQQIQEASNLRFAGLQGYAGRIQHAAAFCEAQLRSREGRGAAGGASHPPGAFGACTFGRDGWRHRNARYRWTWRRLHGAASRIVHLHGCRVRESGAG
jgi:D-serine deaminase-like pyridoxal phosphate-dependent protein